MIQLICRNLSTGSVDIIHEWRNESDAVDQYHSGSQGWLKEQWLQDKSTDHFYDIIEVEL